MSLLQLSQSRDVAQDTIENKTNIEVTTLSGSRNNGLVAYFSELTSTGYLENAQGSTTTTPLSSAFKHISNYFFSNTAGNSIPVSHNTNSTTSRLRAIQAGRVTYDDGIVSGSITAVFSFGSTGNNSYIDIPEDALTSSVGRKGALVSQGNTSNIVGTVFYDSATLIFHGGTGWPEFLVDPASGFHFGTASAGKVVCTQLSFKTLNLYKRSTFFCRAFNKEFNYTNNPTAIADSTLGTITGSLTARPTTFITSVGLYNEDGELLAIAKVSPPVKKTFSTEKSFAVHLQY